MAEQDFGSIGKRGKLPGEIGAGNNPGVRHEIDQDPVEQFDMIRLESRGSLHQQFGDPADRIRQAPGIACLTISSRPGIKEAATDMKFTQTRRRLRVFEQSRRAW